MSNILFIEDNEFDQTLYQHFAKGSENIDNYRVASSISEAKTLLLAEKYDIIITDYDLGDGTSFELFPYTTNTPVIMITGKGNEEIVVSAYKQGIYDYLIKDKRNNYLAKLQVTIGNALELKRTKEQLHDKDKKYKLLVEFANEIIYLTDKRGNIEFINEHGCTILGYDPKEIIGRHFTEFVHEEYVTTAEEFYKDEFINQLEDSYLELPFMTKDGRVMWVGQKVRNLFTNGSTITENLTRYMAFGRDITEKIEAEKQIKSQNLELEQKNREISETLNQLVKAKASRTANAIILAIALMLFIFSEGLLEPLVDDITQNQYSGFMVKGFIALSLKPLDVLVERILMKRNLNRLQQQPGILSDNSRKSWILRFMNLD